MAPNRPVPEGIAPEMRAGGVPPLARPSSTVPRGAPCQHAFRTATRLARVLEIGSGVVLPLLLAAGGCALDGIQGERSDAPPDAVEAVELSSTPFYAQRQYQCGPAALATVLTAAGTAVTPEELVPEVYIPEKQGSLQLELVAATRRRGLIAYPIEPDFSSLTAELHAGRPVLVLQNLGFERFPLWHYAVVIGFDPETRRVLLRSGTEERLAMSLRKFRSTWDKAERWGMIILDPGEFAVSTRADKHLREVAALEALGNWDAAYRGYSAALRRWDGSEVALLGLGNVHYQRHELEEAESVYRRLLGNDPAHPIALNNLAHTLADRGCLQAARATIDRALAGLPSNGELKRALVRTRDQIHESTASPGVNCPG